MRTILLVLVLIFIIFIVACAAGTGEGDPQAVKESRDAQPAKTAAACDDCTFLSAEGEYPDGYCLWLLKLGEDPECVSCFCADGFRCSPPDPDREPEFEGQVIKVACRQQ